MKSMATAYITVSFTAGTDIDEAAMAATKLAKQTGAGIDFDFNGVKCTCFPHGNPVRLVESYHEQIKSESKYPHATN
jgi:hypothetical protein